MASTTMLWLYLLLCCACFESSFAQTGDDVCTLQPTVTGLDPPFGTTGNDEGSSTYYTVSGGQLDQVSGVFVMLDGRNLSTRNRMGNGTAISFYIEDARLTASDGYVNATLFLIPVDPNCTVINVSTALFPTLEVTLGDRPDGQPGSVVFFVSESCVPPECGDNSTSFDLAIGSIILERLSTENTTLKYAGRIPNFEGTGRRIDVMLITQFQTFTLGASRSFNLYQPPEITRVLPNSGQRGTNVTLSVNDLSGVWSTVGLSIIVRLGQTSADIIDSTDLEMIMVRARSDNPGIGYVRINTTYTVESVRYDGPYTFAEDGWTQLMDGNITHIIPPAAQLGRSILLCGNSLLGGGANVSVIKHGSNNFLHLQSTPTSTVFLPGSECLEATIPETVQETDENVIIVVSDTGAIVESASNFSVSAVDTVIPSRGQVGTLVTITGQGLLSGYESVVPTIFLSRVCATLMSASESKIVVRAGAIPVVPPQVINQTTGATAPPPQIIGVMGEILINVTSPMNSSLSFNVTNSTGWQYEEPGMIVSVFPTFGQYGTLITISGTNLLAYGTMLTHATINDVNSTIVNEVTDSMVQLVVPNIPRTGVVDIELFSDTGASVRQSNLFEVRENGVVLRAEPNQGQNGTVVRIYGTNLFGHGDNITSVFFGDTPAIIITANDTVAEVRVSANNNTQSTVVAIQIVADTAAIIMSLNETWTFLVQGQISSNDPQGGQAGTVVTICGSNLFGGGEQIEEITLDGVSATITSSNNSMIVVVPGDLTTRRANFFPGQIYIMSNTGAVVIGGNYTHRASGIISMFSPVQGRKGTVISIVGMNLLGSGTNLSSVEIAGVISTITSFNNMTVVIAAGMAMTNLTGPIVIRVNTGAFIASTTNFTFSEPGSIEGIAPMQGAEGTGVLIRGSALIPANIQLQSITVGGIPVSRVVTVSNQEISVIVGPAPVNNSESAMVLITLSDGSFLDGFNFSFVPLALSLPMLTEGQEGTIIDIGLPSQFNPSFALKASVNDIPATTLRVNESQQTISVRIPRATRSGRYTADVAVEDSTGLIARLRNAFTYLPEGILCDVQPAVGQNGTIITLQGERLLGGGAVIASVTVVGQPAAVREFNDTVIMVQLLSEVTELEVYPMLGSIVLISNTGAVTRRLDSFSLVSTGVILQISPSVGQNGTLVNITGTGLIQGQLSIASVVLAGISGRVVGTPSDTIITVEAGRSTSATTPLPVVIVLSTGATFNSSVNDETFRYLPAGSITNLTPNSGTVGTRVVITGTNLLQGGTNITTVTLNGVPAIIMETSNTSIEVIAQAGTISSNGDVLVISDTGSSITGSRLWTYESLGAVSSVLPVVGQAGSVVTVSGQSLLGSASRFSACVLAGIPARIQGRFNDTMLQCVAGFSLLNEMNVTGPIQVVTSTGVTLTSDTNITFTYYAASVRSISPVQGNNGTVVTISGLNLFTAPDLSSQLARVLFGSMVANIVSFSRDEIIVQVTFAANSTMNNSVTIESTSGSFLEIPNSWTYTTPPQIHAIMPPCGFPGDTISLLGENIVPANVSIVMVIVGQTMALNAQVVNASMIEFQAGIYQNQDMPSEDLPIQLRFPTGETHYYPNILFSYNATRETVNSISPRAGSEHSEAILSGTNLPNSTDNLVVMLAGVEATVLSSTPTEITVLAGRQPSLGAIGPVVVMDTNRNTYFGIGGDAWQYFPIVTNSQVAPTTGQNGTRITIDVSSINNMPAVLGVNLTGVSASDVSFDNGAITARAGPSPVTSLGNITVELVGNIVIIISQAWSYQSPISISNISPSSGYFNTVVTITGNNFQANFVTISEVRLAGFESNVSSQNDTHLVVRIVGEDFSSIDVTGPITILADSGAFHSSEQQINFTFVGVNVTDVTPLSGTQGTLVTLSGVGLLAGGSNISSVTIAGIGAAVQSINSTAVTFVAGPNTNHSNVSDIIYTMDTQATVRVQETWSYINPGIISTFFPSAGSMGTIISISGENLLAGGSHVTCVILNSQRTSNILQSFNNFIQVVAVGTTQTLVQGSIQIISNTGGTTQSNSSMQFSYLPAGNVTSVSPNTGQNGTRLTITGTQFHNGEGVDKVLIAGVEAKLVMENSSDAMSSLLVQVGRPAVSGSFMGPITIFSAHNTTTISKEMFTYLSEGLIFSVAPRSGRNGTIVSVRGENLLGGGTALQVAILAGYEAIIHNQTSSEIILIAPSASSSNFSFTGDIVLVSDTNAHVRGVNRWTYTQKGEIASLNPSEGQYGTYVTINGQNLLSGGSGIATLQFGSTTLEVLEANDTTVMARVGRPVDQFSFISSSISVTSNTGGVLHINYLWSFLNQSTIINIVPPNGTSGEMIVLTGTNLLGGGDDISVVNVVGIQGVVLSSNDSEVIIMAGDNVDGVAKTGNLIIESDTGSQTVAVWTYVSECPIDSFGTADNCQPCDLQCSGCTGPSNLNCTSCTNFSILPSDNSSSLQCVESCPGLSTLDNVCVDSCELNQFQLVDTTLNQTFCHNCSSLCDPNLGCTGPEPFQCQSCLFFRNIVNQTCIESCPEDTFFVNVTKDCVPCDTQCSGGCSGPSANDCNDCVNFRISGTNVGLSTDVCRASCPALFFENPRSNFCEPCDSTCEGSCDGPTSFDCERCRNVAFTYDNGTRVCLSSCFSNYYQDGGSCNPCSSLCLSGEGCTGPSSSECNACFLYLESGSSLTCVSECPDLSYFVRTLMNTSVCLKCDETCGNRGCTEVGPLNCLSQESFSAGPGAVAIIIVIVLILVVVIVILTLFILWRHRGRSFKYRLPLKKSLQNEDSSVARYDSRKAKVQSIPLASIEESKASTNPVFVDETSAVYSEMTADCMDEEKQAEAEGHPLPEKNSGMSASQDLYTDMDNLPPSLARIEEIPASQDLYTDMEPMLPDRANTLPPVIPPKPATTYKSEGDKNQVPPIPTKPEKPPPPVQPSPTPLGSGAEMYTDMQGGITEVFVNTTADDVYDDVEVGSPGSLPLPTIDSTYEDTDTALESMEQYRKSFGAGKSTSTLPRERPRLNDKRMSVPALPSQPIPKKRSSNVPLPATPLQKSLSSASMASNPASPTSSTFSHPGSISSGIPEEESLYDDIGTVLVNPTPEKPPQGKKAKKKDKKK